MKLQHEPTSERANEQTNQQIFACYLNFQSMKCYIQFQITSASSGWDELSMIDK